MDTTLSLKLPPKNYRRTIEELSVVIPDPALKLKFLKQALNEHQKISAPYKLYPPIAGIAFRKRLLNNAENICPGSKKAAKKLIREGVISAPGIRRRWLYKLYYLFVSAILILFISRLGTAIFPLVGNFNFSTIINLSEQQANTANEKIIIRKPIFYSQLPRSGENPKSSILKSANYQNKAEPVSWYYKNPILMALNSRQVTNSTAKPITPKLLLPPQRPSSRNHHPISTVKFLKHRNEPELVLNYYKNPILTALTSQQTNNSKSGPIYQKPLLSAQPQSKGKHLPLPTAKTVKIQNELESALNYIKNPILTILTSQQTNNPKSGPIYQKPLLSAQPQSIGNHKPLPAIKHAEHQNKSVQVSKYLNDPILITLNSQQTKSSKSSRITSQPLLSSQMPETENHSVSTHDKPEQVPKYLKDPIWLVEKTADREFYSNRLQIITTYTISNIPREYYRFSRNSDYSPANGKITDKISGIVYHASESDLYPFMPEMNSSILSYSKRLIKYLLRKKSYNFFIDRFGRVYRLVQEDHAAFHAGKSIWADDEAFYLNLNHSFIGICFEGKDFQEINTGKQKKGRPANSKSSHLKSTGISSFNEAQLRSGKELTDWLRVKYKISQQNCVPHALISVNTKRMLIGFHLDLSRGFPFARLGLTDKYQEPLPSMVEFGFRYDKYFEKIFNGNLWRGIGYSEEILQRRARNSGMSFAEYRNSLQQRFIRYKEWNQKLVEKKDQLTKTSHKQ
jgi:hypothetical protein